MTPLAEQTILVTGGTLILRNDTIQESAGSNQAAISITAGSVDLGTSADPGGNMLNVNGAGELIHNSGANPVSAGVFDATDDRLDALVNNAGIGTKLPGEGERLESRDGHELRFAVNYLAHYALTRSLLPLVRDSAPARIVNVSSAGQAPIDFDDLMLERHYSGVQAYCQSKLAQVMFTFDLAEELDPSAVTANCLHPATYMPTKMVHAAGVNPASSLEEGRDATLRLVADPELDGVTGRYFNGLQEARADDQAYDAGARRQLRELSERLTEAR